LFRSKIPKVLSIGEEDVWMRGEDKVWVVKRLEKNTYRFEIWTTGIWKIFWFIPVVNVEIYDVTVLEDGKYLTMAQKSFPVRASHALEAFQNQKEPAQAPKSDFNVTHQGGRYLPALFFSSVTHPTAWSISFGNVLIILGLVFAAAWFLAHQ